jgi:HSP20 family protein
MAKSKQIAVSTGKVERMPRPFGDFERAFEDFFGGGWLRPFGTFEWYRPGLAGSLPSVDVIDRDEEVVVRAEVPGYRKEDIDISVSNSHLTIKGETKSEEKEEKGDYYRCEISHGSFTRTVNLPAAVEESKAKASIKDGVLELTLPKREKSKRHKITVS